MTPDYSERMWQLAYEMARSGRYQSANEVAVALQSRGFPNAPLILNSKPVQAELNGICEDAARTAAAFDPDDDPTYALGHR